MIESVVIGALIGVIILLRFPGAPWWICVIPGVVAAVGTYKGAFFN